MITRCKVCGNEATPVLDLRNSMKTQTVCETAQESLLVPIAEMEIRYCSACDFYQIDKVAFDHYDDEHYYLTTEISETQRHYQKWLVEYLGRYLVSPVVEIGAGDGFFGQLLSAQYEYAGFEPAKKSFEECQKKNLNVCNSYFCASEKKYNTVISRQVLEHIESLQLFLHDINDSLSEDGMAIFEVPNIDKARRLNRVVDFCPEHLNYFTLSSLALLLSANGFAVIDINKTYDDEYLLIIANKTRQFSRVSKNIDFRSMVFWGAGSRGISLCHMMGALPNYFVDSDRNKVGKYIPSTSIEIKSPAFLYADKRCPPVVITSFFYFEEVLQELHKSGFKGDVYRINESSDLVRCES